MVLDLADVPALGSAHPLLGWVDGTVLVVPYGTARTAAVRRAIDSIGTERMTGLVMNRVPA